MSASNVPISQTTPPKTTIFSSIKHVRWENLVAGTASGTAATIILHPLDLIKIRFQVNEGITVGTRRPQYRGIIDAVSTIVKQDGVRGLYLGVVPNVFGGGCAWGLYFLFYKAIKEHKLEKQGVTTLLAWDNFKSSAFAGACTLTIVNPVWVAKTRLCLQYDKYVKMPTSSTTVHYKGMIDCLIKIYKKEGVRGIYKGYLPGLVGVSHGALQMLAYEELQKIYNKYRKVPLDTRLSLWEYTPMAAMSKIFAAVFTYPYQVVRARLQDQHHKYNGATHVITQTLKLEGWRAFYKGMLTSLIRVVPACTITFVIYEKMSQMLMNESKRGSQVPTMPARVITDTAASATVDSGYTPVIGTEKQV